MDFDDRIACYRALQTRDTRFDGRLFVGVTSTGIYCRPICPARTARIENCRFYPSAAAAQQQGFRPCLRCRPESAPGGGIWRGTSATVGKALALLDASGEADEASIGAIAARLGLSARQLRRLFHQHLGASPVSVLQTRRVLFAKRLIHETRLPMTEVALAAGFGSVRRFNETFKAMYRRPPSALRKEGAPLAAGAETVLRLRYHPPYDWDAMLASCTAMPGVALIGAGVYQRSVRIGAARGTLRVWHDGGRRNLNVGLRLDDVRAFPEALERVGRQFDTAADIEAINAHLRLDPLLAPLVDARPGLRPCGVWDGFEAAVLALVPAAARGPLLDLCAEPLAPALRLDGVERLFPDPAALAQARLEALPLPATRIALLRSVARAALADPDLLSPYASVDEARWRWRALPGIDAASADLLAAGGACDSDAFQTADPILAARSLAWQPWRAYAGRHLHTSFNEENA